MDAKTKKWLEALPVNDMERNGEITPTKTILPIAALNIDMKQYQRAIRRSRIADIAKNFRRSLFAPIHVARRKDGSYWVFDGHQRFTFAKYCLKLTEIEVMLWEGLTIQDEARFFRVWNKGRSQNTPMEDFKARLCEREEIALAINKILGQHGFAPALKGEGSGAAIRSIATVESIYVANGKEALDAVLSTVQAWPGNDRFRVEAPILRGAYELFDRVWEELDKGALRIRLRGVKPQEIIREARAAKDHAKSVSRPIGFWVADVMLNYYNGKKRKRVELPDKLHR